MPDIEWPETLPSPKVNFKGRLENSLARTQMETGRIRQRRRFSASQKSWSFDLTLNDDEYLLFQDFVQDTLDGGSSYFLMEIPDGNGIEQIMVRFVDGNYAFEQLPPDNWLISFTLEKSYAAD
jgi:hypothetical protein